LKTKIQKMKIALVYVVVMLFPLTLAHSASWEGSDDFSSSSVTESLWGTYNQKIPSLYTYVANGRLGVIHNSSQHATYRVWGRRWHKLPTAACWTIQADFFLSSSPTSALTEFTKLGLGVTPSPNSKNDIWLAAKQEFSGGSGTGPASLIVDYAFISSRDDEGDEVFVPGHRAFRITLQHDALRKEDLLTMASLDTGETLEQRRVVSEMAVTKTVGAYLGISGKPSWSSQGTDLGIDNWSVVENNPDPINLLVENGITPKGVAYSVAVTNLDLVNQRLTGTVALVVGTASATLPITGSIDKNGFFALTAKGTGANKGFGCVLLYDVATGTYWPSKNTVMAPKQKAIKF
jgi:hypothetical protein